MTEGNTKGRDNASAFSALRGQVSRHWHVRMLHVREPGGVAFDHGSGGPHREDEES